MSGFRSALVSNASAQREPGSRAHSCPHLKNFLTAASTSTDKAACTQQPHLRPGCHLHAVSSSDVVVAHSSTVQTNTFFSTITAMESHADI